MLWRNYFWIVATIIVSTAVSNADEATRATNVWTLRVDGKKQKIQAKPIAIRQGKMQLADATGKKFTVALSDMVKEERNDALTQVVGSGVVVVHGTSAMKEPQQVIGSGFVIHKDGRILTNYHVVSGMDSLEVEFRDHSKRLAADCLAIDRDHDVAILKVKSLPKQTHVIELAIKSPPKAGDAVWTVGHPKGLKNTIGWGDVNAARLTKELPEEIRDGLNAPESAVWIQTDAVLDQGSSGGPLLNPLGQALGINTFIAGRQIGFAPFVAHARSIYQESLKSSPMPLPLAPGPKESALAWISRELAPVLKTFEGNYGECESAGLTGEQLATCQSGIIQNHLDRFVEIMNREPNSWPSLQAALLVCGVLASDSELSQKSRAEAVQHLIAYHLDCPDLAKLVIQNAGRLEDDSNLRLCQAIIQKESNKPLVAAARIGIALHKLQEIGRGKIASVEAILTMRAEVEELAKQLESQDEKLAQYATQIRNLLAAERVGLEAYGIEGIDVQGKEFALKEYQGKVVLLDFFVDWCPWCKRMYEHNRDLVTHYANRPFAILGVNADNQQILERLTNDATVTWRCWADGQGGPISEKWQVDSYPNLVLVDHRGIVRRRFRGSPGQQELDQAIEQLVGEAESDTVNP